MSVNVLDSYYLRFVEPVLSVAVEKTIGVIVIKMLTGTPGIISATGAAMVSECLRFAQPIGIDDVLGDGFAR